VGKVSVDSVKKLRSITNVGMMDCQKALAETKGNLEKAVELLRKKGIAKASKKIARTTGQGCVESYIHTGGKLGVLLEVNCETDFVARNDEFKRLVKDIAMQVAAGVPLYIKREDVPASVIKKEKEILSSQVDTKKPKNIIDKIVEGKLEKFYQEVCLLEQPFIKDEKITINDLVVQQISKLGENITIKRFVRFQVGEE